MTFARLVLATPNRRHDFFMSGTNRNRDRCWILPAERNGTESGKLRGSTRRIGLAFYTKDTVGYTRIRHRKVHARPLGVSWRNARMDIVLRRRTITQNGKVETSFSVLQERRRTGICKRDRPEIDRKIRARRERTRSPVAERPVHARNLELAKRVLSRWREKLPFGLRTGKSENGFHRRSQAAPDYRGSKLPGVARVKRFLPPVIKCALVCPAQNESGEFAPLGCLRCLMTTCARDIS